MGKGPKPPDPYKTAQAQAGANYQTAQQNAIMGNVNEYTPYGSKEYNQIGWDPVYDSNGKMSYAPRYSSTVQLSPDQQRLLAQQTGLQYNLGNLGLSQSARLQSHLGREMDTAGLQDWQAAKAPGAVQRQVADAGGIQRSIANQDVRQDQAPTDRAAVEKAMMGRYDTDAARQNAAQQAQMAARGLSAGSAGYGRMQQSQDRARTDALQQAFLGSGQESRAAEAAYNQAAAQRFGQGAQMGEFANQAQNQQFNQNLQGGTFANQATLQDYQMGSDWATQLNNLRQGQLQERIALRNQPINEIMALMGGSGPTTPQFQPFAASPMQAPNVGQMIYDNYNARSQQSSNAMSGMFGVGAQVAGALPWASWLSDRRLKIDIHAIGRTLAGVPLYFFRFARHRVVPAELHLQPRVGVMADEVRMIHPDAVRRLSDGYDRVDYGLLMRRESYG